MSTARGKGALGTVAAMAIGAFIVVAVASNKGCNGCGAGAPPSSDAGFTDTSGKYVITFKPDFKKGLAAQDDLGLSVVIAVDCSGSMSDPPKSGNQDKPKYVLASESLSAIVDFFQRYYDSKPAVKFKLGLLKFSDEVTELFPLTEMNDASLAKLKDVTEKTSNFRPSGSTAIGETLATGAGILMQSGTIFRSLIVITDGENTAGVEPQPVLSAIVESRNDLTTGDFPVNTSTLLVSFVGFDIDESVFGDLKTIGSRVTSAGDREALEGALKKIFLADITKLEAK